MSIISKFFGSNPTMTLTWNDQDSLPTVAVPTDDDRRIVKLYLFSSTQPVGGGVDIIMPDNTKKIKHNGIKAELIGQIELADDRGNHCIFFSSQKELCGPGTLTQDASYRFEFSGDSDNDKTYEGYDGINVRLRYFIRITITYSYSRTSKEFDFAVQKFQESPQVNNELKMYVGIEDCVQIQVTYQKSTFHLDDVIIGKILFLLIRIKIKHIELRILKRESTGSGSKQYNETEVIAKCEIMDDTRAPLKGETVPIRLFLKPYILTPTFETICNKFSVKYYLNLVIVDEEERRYFKQQEITLWRQLERMKSNTNIIPQNNKENDIEYKHEIQNHEIQNHEIQNHEIQNHEIQNRLRAFGYNEDVIDDALKNVQNKYDINNLIEYINKKQTIFDNDSDDSDDKDPLFGAKVINKPVHVKQFHRGQEIYCRDLINRKWFSARIKQTQYDGVLIEWNNPKWKASKYEQFIECGDYDIGLKIKTKKWRGKYINEWNCDELIEWIIEINLQSKNEEKIIDTIVSNGMYGADMNSLQDLNDILESFPEIDEITVNKIYIQLLKVRLCSQDNPFVADNDDENDEQKRQSVRQCLEDENKSNNISNINDKSNDNFDEKKFAENVNKQKNMNGPTQQFYEFLKYHRLEQYFVKFKENECCDIRDIEYLIDDEDFLKNDIGIKHKIHRKRLIGECTKLKQQMDIFKETNLIPSILIETLSDYGIVTMHILCKQVEKKMDLKNKLHIDNDNQITLLWNIIQIQIHPEVNHDVEDGVHQQEGVDNHIYSNVLDTAR